MTNDFLTESGLEAPPASKINYKHDPSFHAVFLRGTKGKERENGERQFSQRGYQVSLGKDHVNFGKDIFLGDPVSARNKNIDYVFVTFDNGKTVKISIQIHGGVKGAHMPWQKRSNQNSQFTYTWKMDMGGGKTYLLSDFDNLQLGFSYGLSYRKSLGKIQSVIIVEETLYSVPEDVASLQWKRENSASPVHFQESNIHGSFLKKTRVSDEANVERLVQEYEDINNRDQDFENTIFSHLIGTNTLDLSKRKNIRKIRKAERFILEKKTFIEKTLLTKQSFSYGLNKIVDLFQNLDFSENGVLKELKEKFLQTYILDNLHIILYYIQHSPEERKAGIKALLLLCKQVNPEVSKIGFQSILRCSDAIIRHQKEEKESLEKEPAVENLYEIDLILTQNREKSKNVQELKLALLFFGISSDRIPKNLEEIAGENQNLERIKDREKISELIDSSSSLIQAVSMRENFLEEAKRPFLLQELTALVNEMDTLDIPASLNKIDSKEKISFADSYINLLHAFLLLKNIQIAVARGSLKEKNIHELEGALGQIRWLASQSHDLSKKEDGLERNESAAPNASLHASIVQTYRPDLYLVREAERVLKKYGNYVYGENFPFSEWVDLLGEAPVQEGHEHIFFEKYLLQEVQRYLQYKEAKLKKNGLLFLKEDELQDYFQHETLDTEQATFSVLGFSREDASEGNIFFITQAMMRSMLERFPEAFFKDLKTISQIDGARIYLSDFPSDNYYKLGDYNLDQAGITLWYPFEIARQNINDLKDMQREYGSLQKEYRRTLFHEIAHHVHSHILTANELDQWDKIIFTDQTPSTKYVMHSRKIGTNVGAMEDFAESFVIFYDDPFLLYIISPERYSFMQNIYLNRLNKYSRENEKKRLDQIIIRGKEELQQSGKTIEQAKREYTASLI